MGSLPVLLSSSTATALTFPSGAGEPSPSGAFGLRGDGDGPRPREGFLATGGGTLPGFRCAGALPGACWAASGAAERCPEKFISSVTKFLFRSAWASGDEGVSITSFLVLLAKMKLAVEVGDLCLGDSCPSPAGASGPGGAALPPKDFVASPEASPEDAAEALRCTAAWSGFEGTASLAGFGCRVDSARRMGFCGTARSSATAGGSTLTERSRTICSSEGVTMGRLASSLGTGLLLLRDAGSFLVSAREPFAAFLRQIWGGKAGADGGGRGGGGGTVAPGSGAVGDGGEPCCWTHGEMEEVVVEEEGDVAATLAAWFCPAAGVSTASGRGRLEKQASSGGGKSAMDRSCSSGAGGGGGGQVASMGASQAVSGLNSAFLAGGGGGW